MVIKSFGNIFITFWGRSPWMKIPARSYPFFGVIWFLPMLTRAHEIRLWNTASQLLVKKPARWWWIFAGEICSWNRFHTPRHRFHRCPVWSVSYLGLKVFVRKRWGFRVPPKWKLSALVSWHLIKQRRSIYFPLVLLWFAWTTWQHL